VIPAARRIQGTRRRRLTSNENTVVVRAAGHDLRVFFLRNLQGLSDLALDMRWNWNDAFWQRVDVKL